MVGDQFEVVGVHDLCNHGQATAAAGIFQQQQTFVFHPLKRIRGCAWFIRTPAQQMSARAHDCIGSALDLLAAFNCAWPGDHGESLATDGSAIDPNYGTLGPDLAAGELEGVEHWHHAVHA